MHICVSSRQMIIYNHHYITILIIFVSKYSSHLPLIYTPNDDYFYVFIHFYRGTLMELGISPIITSGLVMQLLAGTNNNMRRLQPN